MMNIQDMIQQHVLSLDIRLLMGRQWVKLLKSIGLGGISAQFISYYYVKEPDPTEREDAHISAHPSVWQHFSTLAGRAMDGAKLYFYLKGESTRHAYDDITVPADKRDAIDNLAGKFIAW